MLAMFSLAPIYNILRVNAESFLSAHSFSEPLSMALLQHDWTINGSVSADANGLVMLLDDEHADHGYIASKVPLLTNSFRLTMNVGVHSSSTETMNQGDIIPGDPGFVIMLSEFDQPPSDGYHYGLDQRIAGSGVYFALTSREHRLHPSISFGTKESNVIDVQTPWHKGIYWNYLDKKEFEFMLEVTNGSTVGGFIRSKTNDKWTQAFSYESAEAISPLSKIIISSYKKDTPVYYSFNMLQVSGTDDNMPGYQRVHKRVEQAEMQSESDLPDHSILERLDLLQRSTSNLIDYTSERTIHVENFMDEQRNFNKRVMSMLEKIHGDLSKRDDDDVGVEKIKEISQGINNMMKHMPRMEKDRMARVENMFNTLQQVDSAKTDPMYLTVAILVIVGSGMGYVIWHMKKLEKKHIL